MIRPDAVSARAISAAELTIHGAVLLAFSCAVVAVLLISMIRLARNPEQLHDLQCRLYLARRISLIAWAAFLLGMAGISLALGVALFQSWPLLGWNFLVIAAAPLPVLGFTIYVRRLPFSYPEDL